MRAVYEDADADAIAETDEETGEAEEEEEEEEKTKESERETRNIMRMWTCISVLIQSYDVILPHYDNKDRRREEDMKENECERG